MSIVCAAIPRDRAAIAIDAMAHGKDVMVDKPGVTSFDQLAIVEQAVRETGRIFSICFSERFVVPATIVAEKIIAVGAIGRVIHTTGLGPHRLNRAIRPDWFFDVDAYGGNPDRYRVAPDRSISPLSRAPPMPRSSLRPWPMWATSRPPASRISATYCFEANTPAVTFASTGLRPTACRPGATDGLSIVGTEGTIEMRKYVDLAGRTGTDHVFVVDRSGTRHIDAQS